MTYYDLFAKIRNWDMNIFNFYCCENICKVPKMICWYIPARCDSKFWQKTVLEPAQYLEAIRVGRLGAMSLFAIRVEGSSGLALNFVKRRLKIPYWDIVENEKDSG